MHAQTRNMTARLFCVSLSQYCNKHINNQPTGRRRREERAVRIALGAAVAPGGGLANQAGRFLLKRHQPLRGTLDDTVAQVLLINGPQLVPAAYKPHDVGPVLVRLKTKSKKKKKKKKKKRERERERKKEEEKIERKRKKKMKKTDQEDEEQTVSPNYQSQNKSMNRRKRERKHVSSAMHLQVLRQAGQITFAGTLGRQIGILKKKKK